jgi:hypothetical protein
MAACHRCETALIQVHSSCNIKELSKTIPKQKPDQQQTRQTTNNKQQNLLFVICSWLSCTNPTNNKQQTTNPTAVHAVPASVFVCQDNKNKKT